MSDHYLDPLATGSTSSRRALTYSTNQKVAMATGPYSIEAEAMKERRLSAKSGHEVTWLLMATHMRPTPLVGAALSGSSGCVCPCRDCGIVRNSQLLKCCLVPPTGGRCLLPLMCYWVTVGGCHQRRQATTVAEVCLYELYPGCSRLPWAPTGG